MIFSGRRYVIDLVSSGQLGNRSFIIIQQEKSIGRVEHKI
jgi:hypothetical protein